jgi:hypothetical protein
MFPTETRRSIPHYDWMTNKITKFILLASCAFIAFAATPRHRPDVRRVGLLRPWRRNPQSLRAAHAMVQPRSLRGVPSPAPNRQAADREKAACTLGRPLSRQ